MAQKEGLIDAVQIESKKRKCAMMSSSFKRCKTTIERKAYELSTLCDTPVCVIFYSPNDDVPSCVWPTGPRQVNYALARYLETTNKPLKDRPVKYNGGWVLEDGFGDKRVKNLPRLEGVASGLSLITCRGRSWWNWGID
ncbi:hypothetical protein vseg_015348 [Gypsophila vaccaria]